MRGLALSVSVAYTVAAVIALSVVARKDEGLGGHELTTPVTRVLVATAVMAVATVLAVSVSGATSGFALLGRVTLAVVVGTLAFAGTTVVLATREARRVAGDRAAAVQRPEPPGPPGTTRTTGPGLPAAGPEDPRLRAAHSSIRLVDPDGEPPYPSAGYDDAAPVAGSSPIPFRGRLGDGSGGVPVRHLRPVPGGRGESPTGDPGGGRTTGDVPVEEAEGVVPRTTRRSSMARIRVVTDSACDLSAEMAAEHGVTVVPLTIRFGEEEFVDGKDLTPEEFWARCKASPLLPETAAPSPGAFQEAFLAAADDGYDGVLSLSLSAGVSATYQAAVAAARSVADRIDVRTVDSRSLTMGLGLMVLDVADLAATGADLDALEARATGLIPRTYVYGVVDTLDHLEKGGRIGGARALLGSLLSIKPVVTIVDGEVAEESKQRTRQRSVQYLADKALHGPPLSRIGVAHGAASDIDTVLGMLSGLEVEHPLVVTQLGPVVGTHTGPGTIGVCMVTKDS